jgi:hypothetical protein
MFEKRFDFVKTWIELCCKLTDSISFFTGFCDFVAQSFVLGLSSIKTVKNANNVKFIEKVRDRRKPKQVAL